MNQNHIKIAAIQMHCIANNKDVNVERALKFIEDAAIDGAQLVVLPELFTTGYYCFRERKQELFEQAESIPGPTINAISKMAKKHELYVVSPIFEKAGSGLYYNTAPLIGPEGTVLGKYSKTHIPLGGALEKYYFRAGSKFPVFQTEIGNIGIIICYDRRFPEAAKILANKGADIILIPSSIFPVEKAIVPEDWECIPRARAVENGVFTVCINRAGEEEGMNYFGHSLITSPQGKILAQAGFDECIITATIDMKEIDFLRRRRNMLRDRRPEIYSELVELM